MKLRLLNEVRGYEVQKPYKIINEHGIELEFAILYGFQSSALYETVLIHIEIEFEQNTTSCNFVVCKDNEIEEKVLKAADEHIRNWQPLINKLNLRIREENKVLREKLAAYEITETTKKVMKL